MSKSRIEKILEDLFNEEKISWSERIAIYRCLLYSDQIADRSIGNVFREDVAELLKEVK